VDAGAGISLHGAGQVTVVEPAAAAIGVLVIFLGGGREASDDLSFFAVFVEYYLVVVVNHFYVEGFMGQRADIPLPLFLIHLQFEFLNSIPLKHINTSL